MKKSNDYFLVGVKPNGQESIIRLRSHDLDLFEIRRFAVEKLNTGLFSKVEIREWSDRLVETVTKS